MRKHCFSMFLTAVAAAVAALTGEVAQTPGGPSDVLARTLMNISSSAMPADMAFQNAILAADAPGGEASVKGCAEPPQKLIRIHGTSLRVALDSITAADPRYRWEVHEGVVNLLPAGGLPRLL